MTRPDPTNAKIINQKAPFYLKIENVKTVAPRSTFRS